MTYIVLSNLSRLSLSGGAHYTELKALQMLREELPKDLTVFHGVYWSREYEAFEFGSSEV